MLCVALHTTKLHMACTLQKEFTHSTMPRPSPNFLHEKWDLMHPKLIYFAKREF